MSDNPERGIGEGSEGSDHNKRSNPSASTGGDDDVSTENVHGGYSQSTGDDKTNLVEGAHKIDPVKRSDSNFTPNAAILEQLISMGISKDKAIRALYCTGNHSAEFAISFIFGNGDSTGTLEGTGISEPGNFQVTDEEYKMVFVVNCSLNMGIGKTAAQVAHAALGLQMFMLSENELSHGNQLTRWNETGETKIVLKADSAEQLHILSAKAQSLKLPNYLVTDAGRTQIPSGSVTVLSIFGRIDLVDQVTGQLKLLK